MMNLRNAAAAALIVMLAACSKVTQDNFAKIQDGMSRAEVEAILGRPAEASSGGLAGLTGTSATWKDKDGAAITIQFVNDKVRFKQFSKAGG